MSVSPYAGESSRWEKSPQSGRKEAIGGASGGHKESVKKRYGTTL
jgi:hypothetical protein